MLMEDTLTDTSYDLELEKIQSKILSYYEQLLMKVFKQKNPTGSEEELEDYLEDNTIQFKSETFDDESNEVNELLEKLLKEDSLAPVAEVEKKKLAELVKRRKKSNIPGLFGV